MTLFHLITWIRENRMLTVLTVFDPACCEIESLDLKSLLTLGCMTFVSRTFILLAFCSMVLCEKKVNWGNQEYKQQLRKQCKYWCNTWHIKAVQGRGISFCELSHSSCSHWPLTRHVCKLFLRQNTPVGNYLIVRANRICLHLSSEIFFTFWLWRL